MIYVGIDVAKDKHDCFVLSSEGEVLADVFTIPNNAEGFDTLLQTIFRCAHPKEKIKVGLEATGHYSYNILGFLLDKGLATYVINPLHTNLYRKSLIARELHISLDAIAHAGTSRPNSVSADVLEFFSGKDDAESRDYIDLCRQVEKMKKDQSRRSGGYALLLFCSKR